MFKCRITIRLASSYQIYWKWKGTLTVLNNESMVWKCAISFSLTFPTMYFQYDAVVSSFQLQICFRPFRKPETWEILMGNIWTDLDHQWCPYYGPEDHTPDFIRQNCRKLVWDCNRYYNLNDIIIIIIFQI